MKKLIPVLFILILAMIFTAFGNDEMKIEDCKWEMGRVLSLEESGKIVAVGENEEGEKPVKMTLTANNGELILKDSTNNETYKGAYEEMVVTDEPNDYKIYLDGKEGYAIISENEDSKTTLVMNVQGYDLYFYAE
jgi:NADPH:quinone reductase-like Zn-dependent oxidoreductase